MASLDPDNHFNLFAMVDRKLMLKLAHRLLCDTSKSPSETPPLSSSCPGSNLDPPASPPPAMMNNAGSVPNTNSGWGWRMDNSSTRAALDTNCRPPFPQIMHISPVQLDYLRSMVCMTKQLRLIVFRSLSLSPLIADIEYSELSRIICSFSRSDILPAPEFVQVHQHMQNIIQHKGGSNVSTERTGRNCCFPLAGVFFRCWVLTNASCPLFLLLQPIKLGDSTDGHQYAEEGEEHLPMFNIEESEADGMTECVGGMYPALDETLETFHGEDGTATQAHGSRESMYNYEWVDSIDDVIHVLNGCPEIPMALHVSTITSLRGKMTLAGLLAHTLIPYFLPQQDMAANFGCQDIDMYANLIGLNSFCKTRWAGNQNQLTSGTSSPAEEDGSAVALTDEQCAYRQGQAAASQLLTFDPQQFSMDQIQLLNQIHQVRTEIWAPLMC